MHKICFIHERESFRKQLHSCTPLGIQAWTGQIHMNPIVIVLFVCLFIPQATFPCWARISHKVLFFSIHSLQAHNTPISKSPLRVLFSKGNHARFVQLVSQVLMRISVAPLRHVHSIAFGFWYGVVWVMWNWSELDMCHEVKEDVNKR